MFDGVLEIVALSSQIKKQVFMSFNSRHALLMYVLFFEIAANLSLKTRLKLAH